MLSDEIIKKIEELKLNEKIEIRFFGVFSFDRDYDGEFSYSYKTNSQHSWSYPMKTSEYVKSWKTENGCKRAMITHLERHFNHRK